MKNKINNKYLLILVVSILIAGVVLVVLEKTQVTDFYKKPENRNPQTTQQVVSGNPTERKIDNTPASPQDNQDINKQKESDPKSTDQEASTQPSGNLQAVLNRAYLDAGQVKIRSTVYGTTSGTCTAILIKKSDNTKYTAPSVNVYRPTTDYACSPINISLSSLSSGAWNVSVILESGGKTTQSQSQEVTVP